MSRNVIVMKQVFLAACLVSAASTHAADWSDTSISYRYVAKESAFVVGPAGNKVDVAKNIVALTHISGYKYGTNFFNIDVLKSDSNNPAHGGTAGAQEVFAIYRHDLSLSAISGSNLKFGPIKDVTLTAGFNAGAKNDDNSASPRALVIGPTLQFALPAGFLNVGLQAYKESNNSAFNGGKQNFDTAAQLNAAWGIPFNAGIPANFKGFLSVTGKKGLGNPAAAADTKTETLLNALVMFDVGSLAGKKETLYVGVGYEYWNNKFGNDEGAPGFTGVINKAGHISAPFLQVEAHF